MEFTLENEHIQIRIKDEKTNRDNSIMITEGSLFHKISALEAEGKSNPWVTSQIENQTTYTSSFVQCEVILRLDDYYLINNIKVFISEENDSEITINKIKFQNINTRLWEWSYFFDPDNKDIITRSSDSISIFSVGLTDYIKLQFYMKFDEEFEGDTTTNSNNEFLAMKKIKNLLNKIVIYSQYIYSIPNATFLMTLLNLTNFFQNSLTMHQMEQNIQDNYLCSLYLTASSMIQARLFIQALELLKNLQLFIVSNINMKNINFFTVVFEINYNCWLKNNNFLQLSSIDDSQEIGIRNHMNSIGNSNEIIQSSIYISMTKIELIKAVSMFEHGHWNIFLSFLRNCIDMYYYNDYSCINAKISLTKVNEIASDKYHIQNFLNQYGSRLTEILMMFIKDKNELISYSVLKVIEFIIDYNPQIIFHSISKIIKHLFKLSYYSNNTKLDIQTNAILDSIALYERMKEEKLYCPCDLFTAWISYSNSLNEGNQKPKSNVSINSNQNHNQYQYLNNNNNAETTNCNQNNSLSQVLQKQINYTLDTIITNIDNFDSNIVFNITQKTHILLFDIITHSDKESLLYLNAIKVLKKCFINDHTSIFKLKPESKSIINTNKPTKNLSNDSILTAEFLLNLFFMGIKPNAKAIFKDYLQIQTASTALSKSKSLKNSKEFKDIIQSFNLKSNLMSSLINTHSLIESNDTGSLLMLIFDKVSDHCINCFDDNGSADLLNYINRQLTVIIEQLNTDNDHLELSLYYTYLLLQFSYIVLFPQQKNDIKKEMYTIPFQKHILFHSQFITELDLFIELLFKVEQFTLIHKPSYILFEVIIVILMSINDSFGVVIDFKFESYLNVQYEVLNKYILSNGIFNENITFLLKTLPLCSLNDSLVISSFKSIYHVILMNFNNYYNEDSFQLFTLILTKLDSKQLIDDDLFNEITKAIISKANYKGNSVKQCYNKYFEIIYSNLKGNKHSNISVMATVSDQSYYSLTVKYLINLFNQYKNKVKQHRGNKVAFKECYLELIEMIELMKGYYEYAKTIITNNTGDTNSNYNSNIDHSNTEATIKSMMIFSNESLNEVLKELMKGDNMDETIIAKLNSLLDANYQFLEINQYCETCYKLLMMQIEKGIDYYRLINRTNNAALLNENCKGISRLVMLLNKFNDSSLISHKLKLLIELFNTVNLEVLKHIQLKNLKEELMNFFEGLIVPISTFDLNWNNNSNNGNSISDNPVSKIENKAIENEYYSLILKALTFNLESNDELINFFGIEILLKIFNIKMEESLNVTVFKENLQSNKQLLKWLNSISEKIIKLILHSNYKISLFAIYIIQLLTIDRESLEPILQLKLMNNNNNYADNRRHKLKFTLRDDDDKNITSTPSIAMNQSFHWMNDNEIASLHNFIRDKIIFEYKPKLTDKNDNASFHPIEEDNMSSFDKGIKVDEISDDMDDEFNEIDEASIIPHQASIIKRPNEAGSQINQLSNNGKGINITNNNKDDEDNLTLEELGVVEVDDEIFENFDEENIPILKSNCVRTKGFAAKVKTNQNSRSLLMSEHVQMQNQNDAMLHHDRYRYSNEDTDNGDNMVINQNNANEEFGDVPDLTTKKKNIRPLNGLRPATPPLRNNNNSVSSIGANSKVPSQNSNTIAMPINQKTCALSNKNINTPNDLNLNDKEINIIKPKTIEFDKKRDIKNDKIIEESIRAIRNNKKKVNRCRSEDKMDSKYEIQSMEELFIDEGNIDIDLNDLNRNNTGKDSYSGSINQKIQYQSKFQKPNLNLNLIGFPSSNSSNNNSSQRNQKNLSHNKKDLTINVSNNDNNTIKPPDLRMIINNNEKAKEKEKYKSDEGDKENDNNNYNGYEEEEEELNEIEEEVIMSNQILNFNNQNINNLNQINNNKDLQQQEDLCNSIDADKYLEEELDEVLYQDSPLKNKPNTNRLAIKTELQKILGNNSNSNPNKNQSNKSGYNLSNNSFGNQNPNQLSLINNSKYPEMNNTFTFSNNHYNSPDSLQNSRNLSLNNINNEKNSNLVNNCSRKVIKNIHHLHNIQKKSSSSQSDLNLLQTMADWKKNNYISTKEDFRSAIKKTISQNSNKIINNLKNFSKKTTSNANTEQKKIINEVDISEKNLNLNNNNSKQKNNNTIVSNPNDMSEPKISGMNTPNFNHYNTINSNSHSQL